MRSTARSLAPSKRKPQAANRAVSRMTKSTTASATIIPPIRIEDHPFWIEVAQEAFHELRSSIFLFQFWGAERRFSGTAFLNVIFATDADCEQALAMFPSEEAAAAAISIRAAVAVGYFRDTRARTYPRYPRYPQARRARFRWRDLVPGGRLAFRDEERTSGNGRKFRNATTAEAGGVLRNAGHGSDGWGLEKEA